MSTYELRCLYDGRKSFYGKAKVEEDGSGTKRLISYTTTVAEIKNRYNGNLNDARVFGTYSATTLRHIREFLQQHGFPVGNKSEIVKMYMVGA